VNDDPFDRFLNGRLPSAQPNLRVFDPAEPGFVPLAERTPRQQARLLIALKARAPRPRAFLTREEEMKARPAASFTNLTWAVED
jgi:hypothetical protein